ncbi:MAG: winged helix-turn-helix domain-containing protein [Woeseiaceae bacterium]|nr:winged helix-turn-helix domain-containing protein [Woeseiaceae bacterium]
MIGRSDALSSVFRVLATYAVGCFVVLQVMDIVLEPLGLPVAAIRWVMLAMIVVAPLLVTAVAWTNHRKHSARGAAAEDPAVEAVFRIGHAEVDTARRQIRFAGEPVDVQPKVFDLIEYLIRARDRVVSKDELFDRIWPDVVVSDASLTQSIKRARDLFRQHGIDAEVIRTVSRKGYRFDAEVETFATASPQRSGLLADVVVPAATISFVAVVSGYLLWQSSHAPDYSPITSDAENSLVVLPFANLTSDRDFGYFTDGLTDTLTSTLTTVRDLRVIAQGSAFSFRDADVDYATIGSELQVAHIVEGSVQRNDDALRVTARLIRARDGAQVWSQIYSRPFEDVFALQDDISRAVVEQMSGVLSTQLVLASASHDEPGGAAGAEAYRLLLLGIDRRKSGSVSDLEAAESYFRAALELRPDYPEAVLGLADAIRIRGIFGALPREPAFSEALRLTQQAIELRPDYADAYVHLAEVQHRHLWDFDSAAESYAKSLELAPGIAVSHAAYSRFLSKVGRFAESIREAEIALDLDPRSARAASSLAVRLIRARELDKARIVIDSLAATHPGYADLPWLESNWHIRRGAYRDALESIAAEELDYLRLSLSAIALYKLERTAQAQAALDELIATDADGAAFQIAEVYAQWGDADAAFEWLERAFAQGDPGMAELYSSLNLGELYADPRFPALATRVGLPPLPAG